MDLASITQVYFLGIGGIGMSALARYFKGKGLAVSGYDLVETALTVQLEAEGIKVSYNEDIKNVPQKVNLVVWTPAIPLNHKELIWIREQGITLMKRAEVLGMLSKTYDTIAVAGTHGKTTTSSIIAHVLKFSNKKSTAFLGGILAKEDSNFINGDSELMIVEADEYDRSFLQLYPKMLIIISTDHDHIDIYENAEELYTAYSQLMSQVVDGGVIVLGPEVIRHISLDLIWKLEKRKIKVLRIFRNFDFENIRIIDGRYEFEFISDGRRESYISSLPGIHNVINSCLAIVVCKNLGLNEEQVAKAFKAFEGIKRRFQFIYEGDRVLIDDYAHLPEEVAYAVNTIKDLYPSEKVLGIFQPHLYSRTLEFYKEFAKELSGLDGVILLPIYPARELPIEGVESDLIYNLISLDEKYLVETEELLSTIRERKEYKIIMTIGAADLDKYHTDIVDIITNN